MKPRPSETSLPASIRCRGELPHLYKPGGTYFITFRLADAVLPAQIRAERTPCLADDPFDPAALTMGYDPPITLGSCALKDPRIASLVQSALLHFDKIRYELLAWCVMPNHVHSVVTSLDGFTPDLILHSWKSFTAHEANRILLRQGTFWERESFDHLVRSVKSLEKFIRYIEENPMSAGLCAQAAEWEFSSARCSLLAGR